MEVHHHSTHASRKWTHYVWEFIMLFLAVFCGFLAENKREKIVERHREKEYARSLYNDLIADTFTIQRTVDERDWIIPKLDSALAAISNNDIAAHNELLYFAERYLLFNDVFTSQDVTYQQLKSSGNFRYFNITLYKEISGYYNLYSRYQSVDGPFSIHSADYTSLEARLFDPADLESVNNKNATTYYNLAMEPTQKLTAINQDSQALKEFHLRIADKRYQLTAGKTLLYWLKDKADTVISMISKEYHLK